MKFINLFPIALVFFLVTNLFGQGLSFSPMNKPSKLAAYVVPDCEFSCYSSCIFPLLRVPVNLRCYFSNLNQSKKLNFAVHKDDPKESAVEILQVGTIKSEPFAVRETGYVDVLIMVQQRKEMYITLAFTTDDFKGGQTFVNTVVVKIFAEARNCGANVETDPESAGYRRLFGLPIPLYLQTLEAAALSSPMGERLHMRYELLSLPMP